MNRFEHNRTTVVKSAFDFTGRKEKTQLKGNVEISGTTGTPKDPEQNKTVRCMVEVKVHSEDDSFQIYLKTISEFTIKRLESAEKLVTDAKDICLRQAVEMLSEKLDQLFSIHVGYEAHIPILPFSE